MKQLNILLIEDNPGDALLVQEYLKEAFGDDGFTHDWAQSLSQAIGLMQGHQYDIILSDLGLPDSSGEDTYNELIRIKGNVPLVIFTGFNDENTGLRSIKAGADDFLGKDQLNAFILKRTILYTLERHANQKRLVASEQKFRSMFENMAAASCLDRIIYENGQAVDYEIIDINPSFSKMLKLPYDQVVGRRATEVYRQEKAPFLDIYTRVAETGEPASFESFFEPNNIFLHITVSCPAKGYFSTVFTDVSDRVASEKQKAKNEERLSSIIRMMQYKSKSIQDFLDYALDEAIKLTESQLGYIYFYSEEKQEFELNSWSKEVMKSCAITESQTCYELSKTGFWGEAVRQRKAMILNDFENHHPLKKGYPEGHALLKKFLTVPVESGGSIVAVVGVANKQEDYDQTDVLQLTLLMDAVWKTTEQIRTRQDLESSEQKFHKAFFASPFAITITRAVDGKFIEVNQTAEELTGYSREELLGKTSLEMNLYVNQNDRIEMLRLLMKNGSVNNHETAFYKKNGDTIITLQSLEMIDINGENCILSVYEDITDRRRKELELQEKNEEIARQNEEYEVMNEELTVTNQELLKAKERAEQSDRLKSSFLKNMSHEIRTPLNGLLGFTDMMLGEHITDEEREIYGNVIRKSSNELLNIINNVILMSKIETGIEKVNNEETHIQEFIRKIVDRTKFSYPTKSLPFELKVVSEIGDQKVMLDVEKVEQIIMQLIDNAFKFTSAGKVQLSFKITEDRLTATVSDTGIGIEPRDQQHVFELFRKLENDTSKLYRGNGLGLAIAKSFADLLGAKLYLSSVPNAGTTVTMTLPIELANKVQSLDGLKAEKLPQQDRKKILMVDDEADNLLLLRLIMKGSSYELFWAKNGEEAVSVVEEQPHIDLVFMDLKMPVLDGYEATKRIKKMKPEVLVIAQTAYAYEEERTKAMDAGCDEFITKPVTRNGIHQMIVKYLEGA